MADEYRVFDSPAAERLAAYYARMVAPRPLRARSKGEWQQRRTEVREQLWNALGLSPAPDRQPLESHRGGILEREGYRLERWYWQTWPEVWASGWLYLPERLDGRLPAILNPHGHWENGARHPVVQSRCIALAKLGFVALAVDSVHVYEYPTGLTPLSAMTWNNLRALDFLIQRPEVDRDRLGVTGASGGGQQAMYLMALDERVRAGVIAVYTSYFHRILMPEDHHCPCNHAPGLMRFTDETEIAALASPRAVRYLSVTEDWTARFPEQELGEIRAVYRLWQQPDRLDSLQFESPHDYHRPMREAAYTWFERELRGRKDVASVTEPEHETEALDVLSALDDPPPNDRGLDGIRDWYRKRVPAQPPQLESKQSRRGYQERIRGELAELLGLDAEPVTLDPELRSVEAPQFLTLRSERDVRIPALWFPGAGEGPWRTVVALHPEGKAAAVRSPLVLGLREAGFALLVPDVRLRGEMQREWLHNCIIWGRPEAGMAVTDILACVQWLWEREEADPRGIVLVGEGDQGVVAMLAAGQDVRIGAVVADCRETTYRDGGEGLPVIPNVLRTADVPQIAGLVAPRPLWLYGVPEDRVGFSSRRYYEWTRRTYQSLGEVEALKMTTRAAPDPAPLAEWLEKQLRRSNR